MRGRTTFGVMALAGLVASLLTIAEPAMARSRQADTLITVGSPVTPFAQNKQNEPGVAIDPSNPLVVAAGANDEIDVESCAAGDPTTCPFTPGIGTSGVYFSFDGGATWAQPTYTGLTARNCLGPDPCEPEVGPIGTLPDYYENGLVSDGDPSLAFGPRFGGPDDPVPGKFSWDNGSRLYYANLTSNLSGLRNDKGILKGFEGILVSRTDDVAAAAAGDQSAWMAPVIASKQSSSAFSDHEQIWVDNVASSPFFGTAYVCYAGFRSVGGGPEPIMVARSSDGGDTWKARQLSQATNNGQTIGRQDCNVRTDSEGTVYVIWEGGFKKELSVILARSFDGGKKFERPRRIATFEESGLLDPVSGDLTPDGVAGARGGTFPWMDIANGAPSGDGATDEIHVVWVDGPTPSDVDPGPNEQLYLISSSNGGNSFSNPIDVVEPGDRPYMAAVATSPDGSDVYVTYDALLQPWQSDTSQPRLMQGVVRQADVSANGNVGAFTTIHRGPLGDARGSSANALVDEFLGDYNNIAATNDYVMALWNDAQRAADCPAIDAYRESLVEGDPTPAPAPLRDCPATFGNSDIFGAALADPTP